MRSTRFTPPFVAVCVISSLVGGTAHGAEPKRPAAPEGLVLKTPAIPKGVAGTVRTLNEALSRDLAPHDNAGVWLVQVFGDGIFEPEIGDASREMLGIASVAEKGPRFWFLEEYVESLGTVAPENVRRDAALLQDAIEQAGRGLWKPHEFPTVAAYLKTNQAALDVVVAAADLTRYYVPVLATDETPHLLSASRVVERRVPWVARTLTARALLRAGARDLSGASADLLACHKLALLLAEGSPFDVSCAKASAADGIACEGEFALLKGGTLTGGQATELRSAIERLPRLVCAASCADRGERAILRQEIDLLRQDQASVREFFDLPKEEAGLPDAKDRLPAIKWELAFKQADEIQDRIVRALATRDHREQNELFDQLDRDYDRWNDSVDSRTKELAESLDRNIEPASRWIGETMAMSLRPFYRQRRISDDRTAVRRDLAIVGLALVTFQRDHGEFPTALSDLTPRYLEAVPVDAYSDAPFAYRRQAKDLARLISWGPNRADDAGKTYNDDQMIELR